MDWKDAPQDYQLVQHESLKLVQRCQALPPLRVALKIEGFTTKETSFWRIIHLLINIKELRKKDTILNLFKLPVMSVINIFS